MKEPQRRLDRDDGVHVMSFADEGATAMFNSIGDML